MQRFLAVLAATFVVQSLAYGQTRELATKGVLLDRVAAVVNDGVVLSSELDEQIAAVSERLRAQKLELPPQNVLRQQVLERLVLEQIQMQRADKAGHEDPGRGVEQRAAGSRPAEPHRAVEAARGARRSRASTTPRTATACARSSR